MKIDSTGLLSINRVAMQLNISDHTIRRWYKWWESEEFEKPKDLYLPPYYHIDRRMTKYFKIEDVGYLKEFMHKIQTTHRGYMSDFNAVYQWGKRGNEILAAKNMDPKAIKARMR